MYELEPKYDRAKSFYRKAFVEKRDGGIDLYSYESKVATAVFQEETGSWKLVLYDDVYEDAYYGWQCYYESNTTRRHVSEFSQQWCHKPLNKAEMYAILEQQKKEAAQC